MQLGEFVTLKRGYDLPSSRRVDGSVPVVSSSGVTGHHDTAKVKGPGVVTGRYGTLGEVFFITDDFWPLNTSLYVRDFKGNEPRFSAYVLESVLARKSSDKAAVPGVNRNDLHGLNVRVTRDLGQQRAVVSILSAYDDLAENNRRRIRLLEQTARLIYQEWFVHLRFPGYEHVTVTVTDGMPQGWERRKIGDICETVGGGTPSTKVSEYWHGDIPWVVPSDVTKNDCFVLLDSERKITEKGLRDSSTKMVPADTILMTSRASVGFFGHWSKLAGYLLASAAHSRRDGVPAAMRPDLLVPNTRHAGIAVYRVASTNLVTLYRSKSFALVDTEVCTNQGFINIVTQDEEARLFLLFNLASRVDEIRSNAKGTTYPEISKARFREMDVLVPSPSVTRQFARVADDIIRQVLCLKRSVCHLARARDILLPRLMNGGIAA